MSSLHALLRKHGAYSPMPCDGMTEAEFESLFRWLMHQAMRPKCILVNAQSVANDLITEGTTGTLSWPPCITPPFESMWIEFKIPDSRKYAVQTIRQMRDKLTAYVWQEEEETLGGPTFRATYVLDQTGAVLEDQCTGKVICKVDDSVPGARQHGEGCGSFATLVALQALSRMNCKNVELRPIKEAKFRPHAPNKVVPASVWHEIVITSVPKTRSGGKDIFEKDKQEIRAHWIRGHYADYRKGAGLFGNPKLKGLFWIPEHRKGNEELGQVIPEYTIQ